MEKTDSESFVKKENIQGIFSNQIEMYFYYLKL